MSFRFAALGCAAFIASIPAKADERQAIATAFNSDPQYLVINLPPRPDTWPGAIFTTSLRLPIKHGDPQDPALHRGPAIGINSNAGFDLGASANGGLSGFFGVSANAGDAANVTLYFPDARIIDMDVSDLILRVKASKEAVTDAALGHIPLVVVRSYLGTPTVTITKKSGASASAWAKARTDISMGAKATAEAGNSITYTGKEEIIFAFETSEIHIDAEKLNKGAVEIQLSSLPAKIYAFREDAGDQGQSTAFAAQPQPLAPAAQAPAAHNSEGDSLIQFASSVCNSLPQKALNRSNIKGVVKTQIHTLGDIAVSRGIVRTPPEIYDKIMFDDLPEQFLNKEECQSKLGFTLTMSFLLLER